MPLLTKPYFALGIILILFGVLQSVAKLDFIDYANTQKIGKYPELTQSDASEITNIINGLIDRSKIAEDSTHPFLAGFVRLIFHDCVGTACDGCINIHYGPNGGLQPYIMALNGTYHDRKYRLSERMSQADFWALAGIVAARKGSMQGGQMLTTKFRYGRVDCATSPDTKVEDVYPDAHADARTTLGYWQTYFGFTYPETTALLGAHSLGKCHKDGSGFDGPWTSNKDSLDNTYYRDMMNSHLQWRQQRVDADHVQWVHGDSSTGMMLNADMALLKDIKPDPQVSNCAYAECGKSPTAGIVETFANDNSLFVREFSSVFQKMIEHGYSNLKELGIGPQARNRVRSLKSEKRAPRLLHSNKPSGPKAFTRGHQYQKKK
eukprot:CAMPEP_0196572712 /NCGR_PEP_ID=MMETSP1081-20130531/2704_1 /TAXON_ID=36882 /ORGANISM="Pyramimonas amylifera, Strain CCMP720" /LENGTH=376 /DNA_ID=CAMNT_0041890119 /DNA_START=187 /DNA_END=1317 /DNA_ORIENTATION=+